MRQARMNVRVGALEPPIFRARPARAVCPFPPPRTASPNRAGSYTLDRSLFQLFDETLQHLQTRRARRLSPIIAILCHSFA
jgi:hypothetical protein